jgi:hypothetical protein
MRLACDLIGDGDDDEHSHRCKKEGPILPHRRMIEKCCLRVERMRSRGADFGLVCPFFPS